MAVRLLQRVGFEWDKHPHRLHTMEIAEHLPGGIELRGGPWTTGERANDTIESCTEWSDDELDGTIHALASTDGQGPGIAETVWELPHVDPDHALAIVALDVVSTSHPAGFNVAGFGVGIRATDGGREAWLRMEAGKVPERPERFAHIEIEASVTIAEITGAGAGPPTSRRLATTATTPGGFRPHHAPVTLPAPDGRVVGLAGWSWSITNTPTRRGRYLRGFSVEARQRGATMSVSNRGEVTRPTDLDLTVDVVVV